MADHVPVGDLRSAVGFGATPAQQRSSDPHHSVWVTANAGTGKTRVLVDRALRLLLDGNNPESILCLTFTKAAAAEMLARIETRLSDWATKESEKALALELEQLTGSWPSDIALERAKRLFVKVMDLPSGLSIMTIHAFCQSVLRRFPFEAGIVPHFEVMDERTASEMLHSARDKTFACAQRSEAELSEALATLAIAVTEQTINDALSEALNDRKKILEVVQTHGDISSLRLALCRLLDVPAHLDLHRLSHDECMDGVFDVENLVEACNRLIMEESESERQLGCEILTWLNAAPLDRVGLLERYLELFLTQKQTARARLISKRFIEANSAAANTLRREQARIVQFAERRNRLRTARRTLAIVIFSHRVIQHYEDEKRRHAGLDYDDLIEITRRLLARPGAAEWVLFKLDARIDHLLVDEAQDTSPDQWEIIERLVAEFHVGQGARTIDRTLFVVGDDKQSIYSFRGADLKTFRALRERLAKSFELANLSMRRELLDLSFRSNGVILEIVDKVFVNPEAGAGVIVEGETVSHSSARRNEPGLIEVWPLVAAKKQQATQSWPLPTDRRDTQEPERHLAEAIARKIRHWLDENRKLDAADRAITAGDILILLSKRGRIQEFLVRAFKRERVPVAGADRLELTEHIAVQDLVALGQAILLPEDDLNFAAMLRSPFFGLDEDDLFELAWMRDGASIWSRLRDRAKSGSANFAAAAEQFAQWQQRADFMPPFEFYAHILGPDGQRKRLLERLGPDALEPIEAFLSQALVYENGHPASLQGFLHWLQLKSQTLKRDSEPAYNQVRIMTVHGAKGLEAPIVFLADAAADGPLQLPRMVWHEPSGLPLWRGPADERSEAEQGCVDEIRQNQDEERHRLLYVAMTRARDELYVCGCASGAGSDVKSGTWYELISESVARHELVATVPIDLVPGSIGRGLRVERRGDARKSEFTAVPHDLKLEQPLPIWAKQPAAMIKDRQPTRITASTMHGQDGSDWTASDVSGRRLGTAIHRLLEQLPHIEQENRERAISRYLKLKCDDFGADELETVRLRILQILSDPQTASLFQPESLAEQPIAGIIEGIAIGGQIDRMVIERDQITFFDYKTNRSPPANIGSIPHQYIRQIAAYHLLIEKIYPDRPIAAGILWTSVPRLDFLDYGQLAPYMAQGLKRRPINQA